MRLLSRFEFDPAPVFEFPLVQYPGNKIKKSLETSSYEHKSLWIPHMKSLELDFSSRGTAGKLELKGTLLSGTKNDDKN